ncbi:MAG: sigma-54 dependent transcriptional regulator [Dysgonamonadaceae bacterium]|jgi:two-component system response regulator HydG|nr:sigma-54 dependent transcriptional regulator [Dysgonamonadaceae bacterium]
MNILILDDDITLSLMLKTWLTKKDYTVQTAISVATAKKEMEQFNPELVISDLRLPDDSGISFLKWAKAVHPQVVFIMMTSYADIQTAVEAIRSGAYDYVNKPINPDSLLKKIQDATEGSQNTEPEALRPHFAATKPSAAKKEIEMKYVQGQSSDIRRAYELINIVAPTNLSVFIEGESGTGKEHLARLIHKQSKRADGPFVPVDCGVMNKELSASEFFGHVKGSFTGAISNKKGHFEEASGGTLFLDEIGNLSTDIQMQLLRVLQEKKIKPVGSSKEIAVDVRIVSATNEDLKSFVDAGKFRRDLYHRVNEFQIHVPSLHECKEDIQAYAEHFLEQANQEMDKQITGFDEKVLNRLKSYEWPGNIRELRNIVFRVVLMAKGPTITSDLLPENLLP